MAHIEITLEEEDLEKLFNGETIRCSSGAIHIKLDWSLQNAISMVDVQQLSLDGTSDDDTDNIQEKAPTGL